MSDKKGKLKNNSFFDLIRITLILPAIISISIYVDFHEKVVDFTKTYEAWELDEILFIGTFFTIACILWYTLRRSEELKKSEELIKANEARYRSLVESTDNSVYLIDRNYKYLFINKKHLSRMKLSEYQLRGKAYSDFHSHEETKIFNEKIDRCFKTGESVKYEYKSNRDDMYFLQTFSPVKDNDGKVVSITVVSQDITDRKQMEEELRILSFTDELTGLYNRRGFFFFAKQQLKLASRYNKGIFIFSADLDDLKFINDNFGHKTGDSALTETANILRETFRKSDIIARIGDDEFVILGLEDNHTSIESLTYRLKANMVTYNTETCKPYELSLSFSFTKYDPNHPCTIDELLSKADILMYEEKRKKKSEKKSLSTLSAQ